VMLDSV